jgi:hypothetical protein
MEKETTGPTKSPGTPRGLTLLDRGTGIQEGMAEKLICGKKALIPQDPQGQDPAPWGAEMEPQLAPPLVTLGSNSLAAGQRPWGTWDTHWLLSLEASSSHGKRARLHT